MLSNFEFEATGKNYGIEINAVVMKDKLAGIKTKKRNLHN